jgi:tetratricopeptide (TPR) repeat protein
MVVNQCVSDGSIIDVSPSSKDRTPRSESSLHNAPLQVPNAPSLEDAPKPFFIFDWLDQVKPDDLERARKILQTSKNSSRSTSEGNDTEENVRKEPFPASTPCNSTTLSSPKTGVSHFLQRSIAIGNGWNARGLQKAKKGVWNEALACWENALEVRTQVLGEIHIDVANTCNNIGIALGKLGRFEEAVSTLHRALDIRTGHYGKEHSEVAATLHNIGNVLHQAGDLEAAIQCFCETKLLQEHLLGPDHVQVARACIAMGHIYYQAEEYKDAREAYLDALSIFERAGVPLTDVEVRSTRADIKQIDRVLFSR